MDDVCVVWFRVMTLLVTDLVMTFSLHFSHTTINDNWQGVAAVGAIIMPHNLYLHSGLVSKTKVECTPSLLSTPYCWCHIQYDKNPTRLQTNSKHSAVGGWVRYFGQKHFLSPSHILCCSWTGRQRQRWERQTSTPPLNLSSPSLSGATRILN